MQFNTRNAILSLITLLFLTACSHVAVDDGQEAVIVKKPWFFGDGGTVLEPHTGAGWYAPSTSSYIYSIRPEAKHISFDDIISNDNVPMGIEATVVLRVKQGYSPVLHNRFGREWYDNNIERQFSRFVRNFVRQNDHTDLVSDEATNLRGQEVIFQNLVEYIEGEDMPIIVDAVVLGRSTPPEAILEQIAATGAQNERARTEVRRAAAEEARFAAEQQKAKSDMAYMEAMGFTPEQYIAMRQLEIEREKVEMVRSKENVHIIMQSGTGASAVPTFGVGKQ